MPESQHRLMGMSTLEWAQYLSDDLGVGIPPTQVADMVIGRMARRYQRRLPVMPGALAAVQRLAAHWPLGLASSSPRRLVDAAVTMSGLGGLFATTVSTEEV